MKAPTCRVRSIAMSEWIRLEGDGAAATARPAALATITRALSELVAGSTSQN